MVGVQDPEHLERLLQTGIGLVLDLRHLEHHREEVARVGEVVVGIDVGQPEVVAVGEGGERRHLRDQPNGRHVPLHLVVDVLGVGVEGRQRAGGGEQHPHRVGVVAEALDELLDVLVDVGVVGDLEDPLVELLAGGQLAVDQEIGDLEVGGVLAELLDRVAAVLEHARLAVDVCDRASTRRRVREGGVVGHQPEVVVRHLDLAEVHRLHGPVADRDLVVLARAVVGDRQGLAGRGYATAVVLLSLLVCHRLPLVVGHPLSFPRIVPDFHYSRCPGWGIQLRRGGRRRRPGRAAAARLPGESVLLAQGGAGPERRDHSVVLCDIKGYGYSRAPPGGPLGEGYSKREMAAELVEVMDAARLRALLRRRPRPRRAGRVPHGAGLARARRAPLHAEHHPDARPVRADGGGGVARLLPLVPARPARALP